MTFNCLFRNLLRSHGRYPNLASLNPNNFHDFMCPIVVKYISSNSNEQSFTVSYLINTCRLSPESASTTSRKVQFETPEKPDLVVNFFKRNGFLETQISEIIRQRPRLLLCNPEKALSPKLEFFHSKGVSSPDRAKILSRFPPILQRSLENQIIPSFHYLCNLLQSSEKAITAIKRSPCILGDDLQNRVEPKVNYLRDIGVPESNIVRLLCNWPIIFLNYPSFENTVDLVKKMGINPIRSQFVIAIVTMLVVGKSEWDKKIDVYKRWGCSEEEILTSFRKHPWCMMISVDKIIALMDIFVNKMGWDPSVVVKHYNLLTLSLEKRLIPRAAVLQYLSCEGLLKNNRYSPVTAFRVPEEAFLQRFVNCYEEAPLLMKLYREAGSFKDGKVKGKHLL